MGGPDGGNGGKGGDVVLKVDSQLNTLLDFKYKRQYKAEDGKPGEKSQCTGRSGESLFIKVPKGTLVKDTASGDTLADLVEDSDEYTVALGGIGGRGNAEFATPTNQTQEMRNQGDPVRRLKSRLNSNSLPMLALLVFQMPGNLLLYPLSLQLNLKLQIIPLLLLNQTLHSKNR